MKTTDVLVTTQGTPYLFPNMSLALQWRRQGENGQTYLVNHRDNTPYGSVYRCDLGHNGQRSVTLK